MNNLPLVLVEGATAARRTVTVSELPTAPAPKAGQAQIVNNILSDCRRGRIVGFDREKAISGDLADGADRRFVHLTIHGNTGQ